MISTISDTSRNNLDPIGYEMDAGPLPLKGGVPAGLRGTLVRNGPNPVVPDPQAHWFTGDGMLHAFHIRDGEVRYRNRWVRTTRWEYARARSCNPWGSALRADSTAEHLAVDEGSANTNIICHARRA